MKNILYISLTGMTEALGRSQVLEYLIGLSKENNIYLISFERENDLKDIDEIKNITNKYNIHWKYLIYSNRYGIFSTIWQIQKVMKISSNIIVQESIKIVHSRSMIPALTGMILKKIYGIKLIFDIRGFFVDEKVDYNILKNNSFLFRLLKSLDNYLYKKSDHIVVLTHRSKDILNKNLNIDLNKITVIPTCVSKDVFKLIDYNQKINFKKKLGFKEEDILIIHAGTVLNRYDFDAELTLFYQLNNVNNNIKFLILNQGEHEYIKSKFIDFNISKSDYKIMSVNFSEVYKYLNISDFSLFFIPPTFAKIAMAPTKFAENIVSYLPSITNIGVGDMEFYMKQYDVGYCIDIAKLDENLSNITTDIIKKIDDRVVDKDIYDKLFSEHFDAEMAIIKYQQIYDML